MDCLLGMSLLFYLKNAFYFYLDGFCVAEGWGYCYLSFVYQEYLLLMPPHVSFFHHPLHLASLFRSSRFLFINTFYPTHYFDIILFPFPYIFLFSIALGQNLMKQIKVPKND